MILAHATHLVAMGHDVTIKTSIVDTVFPLDERLTIQKTASKSKLQSILKCLTEAHDSDWVVADIVPLACLLYFRNRQTVLYFAQDYDESYYSSFLQKIFIRSLYHLGLSWLKIPVVAVSDYLQEILSRRFNARVAVVTNGVDLDTFFPDPDSDLLTRKKDRKVILILSRGDRRKGFDLAKSIVRRVKNEITTPFEVWTVGDVATGCFEGVCHRDFGYVREEKLRKLFSSADVFLYPTRHEGFGLMVAEAFASGCPVVTTDAVPFVKDGQNALVSQIEDVDAIFESLQKLLSDPERARHLVNEGIAFANEHSLASACRRFAAILEKRHALR
ncbi:MAG: glycosyltransferase family 4 protein [Desulfuromonadales bacterium]|nr:glycosyltransferase family 4 protein [Desulfuromonadales bacterium]